MHFFSFIHFYSVFCAFLCSCLFSLAATDGSRPSSVRNALVPGFDKEGRLAWELRAAEVSPLPQKLYKTAKPYLKFFDRTGVRMEAKSTSGVFNLRDGLASGDDYLLVEGTGFTARGKSWKWSQVVDAGSHQMVFGQDGKVSFSTSLRKFFPESESVRAGGCQEESLSPDPKNNLTVAEAEMIEFLAVNERVHHFFLEGNVSVESSELLLTSKRMKVVFEKEDNSSSDDIGQISLITAFGEVKLSQSGRTSYCDSLSMDVLKNEVLLEGKPARVVDEEWGAAVGNQIILEKGERRARVLGGKPRLELPAIPSLGFERKGKRP